MIRLSQACPSCGRRPWSDHAWQSMPAIPHQCLNRLPVGSVGGRRRVRPICGADLCLGPTIGLSADELLAQDLLTRLLDEAATESCGSRRCHGVTVTPAMRLHVFTELLTENLAVGDENGRPGLATALANTARQFTAFDSTSRIDGAVPRQRRVISPLGSGRIVLRRRHSPIVTAACLAAQGTNFAPATQLQYRTGRRRPAYPIDWLPQQYEPALLLPEHRTDPLIVPLEWVPQRLWRHEALGEPTPGRAVVLAMCLLKLGRTAGWATIASWLHLPRTVRVTVRTELTDLRRTGAWNGMPAALEQVFETLRHEPPPIDYQARRKAGALPGLIDQALREAVDAEAITETSPAVRARFWELLTGGYAAYDPTGPASPCVGDRYPGIGEDPPWLTLFDIFREISPVSIEGPLTWTPTSGAGRTR